MKVTISNIVEGDGDCGNCDRLDGVYAPLQWIGLIKQAYVFCDGTEVSKYCLWRIVTFLPCVGFGFSVDQRTTSISLQVAKVGSFYLVEVRVQIESAWNYPSPIPIFDKTDLRWMNRYGEKPDCENWEDEVMGTLCAQNVSAYPADCDIGPYTLVLLTALEACS
jgi:hypothetical protein